MLFIYYILLLLYLSQNPRFKTTPIGRKNKKKKFFFYFFSLYIVTFAWETWDSGRNRAKTATNPRKVVSALSCWHFLALLCPQKKPGLSPRAMSCYLKWYVIIACKCALFVYIFLYVGRCLFKAWFWFGLWLVSFFFFLIRFHYRHF